MIKMKNQMLFLLLTDPRYFDGYLYGKVKLEKENFQLYILIFGMTPTQLHYIIKRFYESL